MRFIDLRSDTVTRPTPAMREAMARADVGDDVYGEDPTVNRLEATIAEITGKEAAVFVPSGTMGNQIALLCHARRGDEVLVGEGAHMLVDETGAAAAWAGVQFQVVGRGGLFTADDFALALREPDDHCPTQRLCALENPHNRAGGRTFPEGEVHAITERARAHGLALHLDGARLWNAAVASGRTAAELAAPFDTVNVCFSKGLGAPVGSVLVGPAAAIARARVQRKRLGGGWRQAGILAAGGLYALEQHVERLADDHVGAQALAQAVAAKAPAAVDPADVETNIVALDTGDVPAAAIVQAAAAEGVRVGTVGTRTVRAVTHLDVTVDEARTAGEVLGVVLARSGGTD